MRGDWKRAGVPLLLGVATLALLAGTSPAQPDQGKKKDEPAPLPAVVVDDPAFERYVDMEALAEAWEDRDAEALTDIGLQLAEGERVLLRSHKGITAEQVLTVAARLAADQRDKKTLQRLSRAAEAQKR